jgi:hypothetical protein
MNFIKKLALASALALVGLTSANALVIQGTYVPMDSGDPGDFDNTWTIDSSVFGPIAKGTAFVDFFQFDVPEDEYVSFNAVGSKVTFDGFNLWTLGFPSSLVDSEAATLPHSLSGGLYLLTSGTYELDIYGSAAKKNGTFELDIFGSPVPEPAGWALMLAGLGAMASLARRRSNRG